MNEERKAILSPSIKNIVLCVGRVLMPKAYGMPEYNEEHLNRLEEHFSALDEDIIDSFIKVIQLLKLRASIFTTDINYKQEQRLKSLIDKLSGGNFIDRQLLHSISVMLKMSYYSHPAVYKAMGVEEKQENITDKNELQGLVELEELQELSEFMLDAIIVGSGAGGAVMAYELASAGWNVLIIEEGGYHNREMFNRPPLDITKNLYRNGGLTFTLGVPSIYLPIGRSVGGTTTINSGTCYRPPKRVLEKWVSMGLEEWNDKDLSPFFDKVERILEVEQAQDKYLGGIAKIIARGCHNLGYKKHKALSRNAPECDGQGRCVFGCPTDAKRSTNISYIPLALQSGAYLSPKTKLKQMVIENNKVQHIIVEHLGQEIKLSSKVLILSTGTLRTPLILKESGIVNDHLGKHLSIHPAASMLAEFEEPIFAINSIPQGYGIEEFHDQGILYEGAFIPPEFTAMPIFAHGEKLQEILSLYNNLAAFGFLVEDEGNGEVLGEWNDMPLVRYSLAKDDVKKIHRGLEILEVSILRQVLNVCGLYYSLISRYLIGMICKLLLPNH